MQLVRADGQDVVGALPPPLSPECGWLSVTLSSEPLSPDPLGRHVDFRNTILIMTSNIGADKITNQSTFGFEKRSEEVNYQKMKDMLKSELDHYFRPEFINRVDEIVVFRKLGKEDLMRIVDLEVNKVAKRLREQGYVLDVTAESRQYLLERGTDEKFGARPLRRAIEQLIEDPLSEDLLRGMFKGKHNIRVVFQEQDGQKKLVFEAFEDAPQEPELVAAEAT